MPIISYIDPGRINKMYLERNLINIWMKLSKFIFNFKWQTVLFLWEKLLALFAIEFWNINIPTVLWVFEDNKIHLIKVITMLHLSYIFLYSRSFIILSYARHINFDKPTMNSRRIHNTLEIYLYVGTVFGEKFNLIPDDTAKFRRVIYKKHALCKSGRIWMIVTNERRRTFVLQNTLFGT